MKLSRILICSLTLLPGIGLLGIGGPARAGDDFYVEKVGEVPISRREVWRNYIDQSAHQVYPAIVVIQDSDYEKMRAAAEQWSRVAQRVAKLFYADPNSLEPYIPAALLDYWRKKYARPTVDPDRIHFISGLDFLRNSSGDLLIIEVNTSVVSGIWAAEEAASLFQDSLGAGFSNLEHLRGAFLEMMEALPDPSGAMVNVQYDIYTVARIDAYASAFAAAQPALDLLNNRRGIRSVYLGPLETAIHTVNSVLPDFLSLNFNHAVSRSTAERLGLRIKNGELLLRVQKGSEISYVPVRLLWPQMLNQHVLDFLPGLWNLFRRERLALAQTPGLELLENKLFQTYMNGLIREFTGEEPVLPFSESETFFRADGRFDSARFDRAIQDPDNWVFKPVAEQGGEGVFLGHELKEREIAALLRRKLKDNPFSYIAQRKLSSSLVPSQSGKYKVVRAGTEPGSGRKIDFRSFAFARTVRGVPKISALPLISSRGVDRSARTHNVAGNVNKATLQLVLPEASFQKILDCNAQLNRVPEGVL